MSNTCILGHIRRHGLTVGHLPAVSPDEIDVLRPIDVSGRARYHLVKAHGMLILNAMKFLYRIIHLPFLVLFIIIFREIKMRI